MKRSWMQGVMPRESHRPFEPTTGTGASGRLVLLVLVLQLALGSALAQTRSARLDALADGHHKSGAITLSAFAPVAEVGRESVVQFERDGERLVLGTVLEATGLVLTKASELAGGDFSCRLSDGRDVPARLVKVDADNDIALVQVKADGMRPVVWAEGDPAVGQWVVTPGLAALPEAVGIVSASPRRIQHRRALIGVVLDVDSREARVAGFIDGLGAERAGLEAGDIVLAVNDSTVSSREELVGALRGFREGQTVRLRVLRAESTLEIDVEMMVPKPDPAVGVVDRTERMNRMGSEVSARADGFDQVLTHDTVLQAWQCGGPLINLDGEAIGLNIARAGRVASYALPAGLVREIAGDLRAGIDRR